MKIVRQRVFGGRRTIIYYDLDETNYLISSSRKYNARTLFKRNLWQ